MTEKEDLLDQVMYGTTILKYMYKQTRLTVWTELKCLRTECSSGLM